MFRWIVILLNLGAIGFLTIFGISEMIYEWPWEVIGSFSLVYGGLWTNFLYVIFYSGDDESILKLWLRVKKAELRKQLE